MLKAKATRRRANLCSRQRRRQRWNRGTIITAGAGMVGIAVRTFLSEEDSSAVDGIEKKIKFLEAD